MVDDKIDLIVYCDISLVLYIVPSKRMKTRIASNIKLLNEWFCLYYKKNNNVAHCILTLGPHFMDAISSFYYVNNIVM